MKYPLILALFLILIALFFLYPIPYTLYPSYAQSPSCPIQSPNPGVSKGLISAPALSGNLGSDTGACVIDPKAPFAPFKIPSYDDLKSLYYTQSKVPTKVTNNNSPLAAVTDGAIYNYTNTSTDITTGVYSYSGTAVVFVESNLSITGNVTGTALTGLVFVVKGDIIIDPTVTTVNAILISQGKIYTAGVGCNTNTVTTTAPLTINGSLISLNTIDNVPIKFCRTLSDNSLPAEKIINQPKYLVILRNILSDTYQKWAEIQ